MFSTLTLKFVNKKYEKQFQETQSLRILSELFNFTLYTMGYCLLSMIEFMAYGQTVYSVISSTVLILSIFIYLFIKSYNGYIDQVLTFYQLLIAIIFEMDNVVDSEEKSNRQFAWFYGFQCCLFHFCAYIQGNNFSQSSIVLLITFIIHMIWTDMNSLIGIINILKAILLLFVMMAVKYTYLKLIKVDFLKNSQQKKFNDLLQEEINSWTMLLSLNRQQDQIVMNWCNKQFKLKFDFQDDASMRKFIRSLKTNNEKMDSITVETQIRRILMDNNLNQKFELQANFGSQKYNIRLVPIDNQNERFCLFLLVPIRHKKINNVRLFIEHFVQHILKKIIQLKLNTCQPVENNQLQSHLLINKSLNMLQLIYNKFPQSINQINTRQLTEFFNNILGNKYSLNCYFQQFNQNYQLIYQLFLTFIDLILKSNFQVLPSFININFQAMNIDLIQLTLTFYLEQNEKFIDWFRNPNPDRCRSIYSSLNQVLEHQYLHKTTKDVSFNVICLKHILNQISPSNSIKIIQSFENIHVVIGIINIKN